MNISISQERSNFLKHKKMRGLLFLFCLFLLVGCTGTGQVTTAPKKVVNIGRKIFLWKAQRPGASHKPLYLYGTIHVGIGGKSGIDRAVKEALEKSDGLALEVDVSDRSKSKEIEKFVQRHGKLRAGKNLLSLISPKTRRALARASKGLGISPLLFLKMRPWTTALTFSSIRAGLAGLDRGFGKERILIKYAKSSKQRIYSLEKVKEQLTLFSTLSPKEEEAYLLSVLLDSRESSASKNSDNMVVHAYESGDLDRIERIYIQAQNEHPILRPMLKKLLDDRNVRMVHGIKKLISQNRYPLVAVGVGHFPGKMGLLSLLKNEGYVIQRVSPKGFLRYSGTSGTYQQPDKNWSLLHDKRLQLSMKFLTKPVKADVLMRSRNGPVRQILYQSQKSVFFSVLQVTVYPPQIQQSLEYASSRNQIFRMAIENWVRAVRGRLLGLQKIKVQGVPALYLKIKNHSTLQEGVLLVHNGLMIRYFVIYIGKIGRHDKRKEWRSTFFRSFRITHQINRGVTL